MLFSCTQKIIKHLGNHKEIEVEKIEPHYLNWYVDLVVLNRKKYYFFMHATSRYSFLVYGGTAKEKKHLEDVFYEGLTKALANQYPNFKDYFNYLVNDLDKAQFNRTNSRSILGTMTESKYTIEICQDPTSPYFISLDGTIKSINDLLLSSLGFLTATQLLEKELLEVQSIV